MKSQMHRFCVAPMMDWTDRHCRVLHRLLSRQARLYTEMLTSGAVIHGNRDRLLGFDPREHPVALQLGGSDPEALARAASIGRSAGYDEINLNCGCPSDRVQSGCFGAALMADPALVARAVAAMQAEIDVPVTVKCRIGIDDQDHEADFRRFIDTVAAAGCRTFIVHARKAWLSGLSPKENREIPPLDYERVYRLKAERPDLTVVINGGITDLDEAVEHLARVDGVMLGRAAYRRPAMIGDVDRRLFGEPAAELNRVDIVARYNDYAATRLDAGDRLPALVKPLMGLFHGEPGGRLFRRVLSEESAKRGAGIEVIDQALETITQAARRHAPEWAA
ncbi:MAG: tRNA dihydrouridine(20/20a) synthase DusA [Hyphomicrobiaceae bacterium]